MNVKSGTLAKAAVAAALSCAIASPFVAVNAYAAEDAPTNNNDATVAAAPAAPAEEATETVAATTPETTAAPPKLRSLLPPKRHPRPRLLPQPKLLRPQRQRQLPQHPLLSIVLQPIPLPHWLTKLKR